MINPGNLNNTQPKAKVELYSGSTLVRTCTCSDVLSKFTVERVGDEGKFFGFGFCQKISVVFLDLWRDLNITTDMTIKVAIGDGINFIYPYPTFYISEVNRNQKSSEITVVGFDLIAKADLLHYGSIGMTEDFYLNIIVEAAAGVLGLAYAIMPSDFNEFITKANLDGSETLRAVLNAVADYTQTIYYIDGNNRLVFKRMDKDGAAVTTINQDNFYELETGETITLTDICGATELGDNITVTTGAAGETQYIRDNPFLELHSDKASRLNIMLGLVGGLSITQFDCNWAGNYLIELGDKIKLVEPETNSTYYSYVLNESFTFDGTIEQIYKWSYAANDNETASNPATIGEKLSQTYARVDKINKEIELVVSDVNGVNEKVSAIELNSTSMNATVTSIQESLIANQEQTSEEIATLKTQVSATMTSEQVNIAIRSEMANGVDKVATKEKNYTFDDEGLTISASDNGLNTTITENGMTIDEGGSEVLSANNTGVLARNLHATTYLIIGNNSRIQDYNSSSGSRSGCFWIGG